MRATLAAASGDLPWVGEGFGIQVTILPSTAPVVLSPGISRTSCGGLTLPFDLTVIGMIGCALYTCSALSAPISNQNGVASITLAIPTMACLLGVRFYTQALALDLAANPLGATSSNGGEARIGAK